ncbi:MAG: biopolymer transporter ExbD, partial [Bacteroidota bacterium]|nr:biopolymer transporter ExbD [Bacteroidota bacterium]
MPVINAASMSDIAFLLLLFFLLVSQIDADKGIERRLAAPADSLSVPVMVEKRNVLRISLTNSGTLMVNELPSAIEQLDQIVRDFVLNYGNNPTYSVS